MKLIQATLILLLSSCVVAQTPASKETNPAQSKTAAAATQPGAVAPKHEDAAKVAISADTAVITVPNICNAAAKDCKTLVTRKEFESTLLGLSGGQPVPPDVPRRFASQYGEVLIFSKEAEKQGIDKDASMEAAIRYARMQVLATRFMRTLQEKAKPTAEEIQKFYDNNQAQFQGISVERLMIPTGHAKSKKPEELKALAEDMKKRLTAGEDAAKLEQEIYVALSLNGPPKTTLTVREGQPGTEGIAKLKVGEVSDVTKEPMALIIYKRHESKTLPLDDVREEVEPQVQQQKLKAAIDAVIGDRKSVLNDAYFGSMEPKSPHGLE